MRRCPSCKLAFRADDPGYRVGNYGDTIMVGAGFPLGSYEVCYDCYRKVEPNCPPPPRPRQADSGQIGTPSAAMISSYLCSVCRRYAREDDPIADQLTAVRLTAADILSHRRARLPEFNEDMAAAVRANARRKCPDRAAGNMLERLAGVRPGVLRCCRDCFLEWAPVVARRWRREGVIGPGVAWHQLGPNLV